MNKLLPILTFTLLSVSLNAQKLYKCDDSKSYWTFAEGNSFYSVKLKGNARETHNKKIIFVDSYPLQALVVDKAKYMTDDSPTNFKALVNHAMEVYLDFKIASVTDVSIQFDKAPSSEDETMLPWSLASISDEGTSTVIQVFVSVIIGDRIFVLGIPWPEQHELGTVKGFLADVIRTLKTAEDKKEFEKLCGK